MPASTRWGLTVATGLVLASAALDSRPAARVRADTIHLKNQATLKGSVDKDNTLLQVSDQVKRTVIRDSKVARVESDNSLANQVIFELVQPLVVHGGAMPAYALGIKSTPWDEKGRRTFEYIGDRSRNPLRMKQAINRLGPYWVNFRGIDGFWVAKLSTGQVPKPIVMGILNRVDRSNQEEQLRVARFFIQAEWYPEALDALDRIIKDFPEIKEAASGSKKAVRLAMARRMISDAERLKKFRQPKAAVDLLKAFPVQDKDLPKEVIDEARTTLRKWEDEFALDRRAADTLKANYDRLTPDDRDAFKLPLAEMLRDLADVPDAVRDRFQAFEKAEPSTSIEGRFALAASGFVAGSDKATADLAKSRAYWKARDLTRAYLSLADGGERSGKLVELQDLSGLEIDVLAPIAQLIGPAASEDLPPPAPPKETKPAPEPKADDKPKDGAAKKDEPKKDEPKKDEPARATKPPAMVRDPREPRIHRVANDNNPAPTEYVVIVPPEYHPLRSYPTIVALHDGRGPKSAALWWAAEAAKHGYIVVAPEFCIPGQPPDYRYTESEHAAAELAIRDAKRRYAIDSDRVFVGGVGIGGNMAWDFGISHPDLFAGTIPIAGIPLKYVFRYRSHADRLPIYSVNGELTPQLKPLIFDGLVRPMIMDVVDVTYVEYFRRGVEELPEEQPAAFDWMDRRSRDPSPKEFSTVTARECDSRFYGVVVRSLQNGRAMAPEAVDPDGRNLRPATIKQKSSSLSNLLNITATGITQLDVWVSPKLIDFKKRMEVRINGKSYFKGIAKLEYGPMLEDLRLRGDRSQMYWMKVSTGGK